MFLAALRKLWGRVEGGVRDPRARILSVVDDRDRRLVARTKQ